MFGFSRAILEPLLGCDGKCTFAPPSKSGLLSLPPPDVARCANAAVKKNFSPLFQQYFLHFAKTERSHAPWKVPLLHCREPVLCVCVLPATSLKLRKNLSRRPSERWPDVGPRKSTARRGGGSIISTFSLPRHRKEGSTSPLPPLPSHLSIPAALSPPFPPR